ncbi:unnamed protein product [Blepharisma stoltei]|uniref:Uncharacterized protein n=1 Tax=Blepharisma stoltei TaxID=1481888 RepID=A0AAU9JKW1_9CILI|nr:unnamed protein product [Blepharisma stoltei]
MKFSRQLEYYKIPEWSAYYIEYRKLTKLIYRMRRSDSISSENALSDPLLDHSSLEKKFRAEFKSQINRLNAFYAEKKMQIYDERKTIFSYFKSLSRINSTIDQEEAKRLLALDERDDAQNRATSMKRAFSDVHKQMWWLEAFCEINYMACLRLLEKLENSIDLRDELEHQPFRQWESEIGGLRLKLYNKVAKECLDGNVEEAKLLLTRGSKQYRAKDIAGIFFCLGIVITCLIVILYIAIRFGNITLCPSYPIFRLTLAVNLSLLSIAYIIYTLEGYSINWVYIFEIDPSNKISSIKLVSYSMFLSAIWIICFLFTIGDKLYLAFSHHHVKLCITLFIFYFILWLWPFNKCYRTSRFAFLKLFFELLISPLSYVRFKNYMLGSWLTSFAIPLRDLYLSFCFFIEVNPSLNALSPECYTNFFVIFLPAFPLFLRFMQNLNSMIRKPSLYRMQLINITRYFLPILLVVMSYFKLYEAPYTSEWLSVFTIMTTYHAFLDMYADWGLLRNSNNGPFLRGKICFPRNYYYKIMLINFFLRFNWTLTLVPYAAFNNAYVNPEMLYTVILVLEIFRRTLWTILRVERENTGNVEKYRKIDYLPKPLS